MLQNKSSAADLATIRRLVAQHAHLAVNVETLRDDSDLYQAGLTSLATVNLMLVLENHFDVEFPDAKLGRVTFASFEAIAEAIAELKG